MVSQIKEWIFMDDLKNAKSMFDGISFYTIKILDLFEVYNFGKTNFKQAIRWTKYYLSWEPSVSHLRAIWK